MFDLIQVLSGYGQSTVQKIRDNLASSGTNASGRTSRSLRYEVTEQGTLTTLRILGRPFFMTVETGRKPTPQYTKPSRDFVASIREWIQAKGGDQGAAYAIARHIHQKGTKLFRTGGRKDIVSNVVNESLFSQIEQDVLKRFANRYVNTVKESARA